MLNIILDIFLHFNFRQH